MEYPNKNKAYFLWDVFQIFFLENNLSLTHHLSYKYYFFSLPSVAAGNNYFGASVSQSHGKLSVFSLLFAFFLLSYSHCLSPSSLSSFQFSQISLSICLSWLTTLPCSIPMVRFLISIMLTWFTIQIFNGSHYSIIRHCNYCQTFCIQKHQKSR